MATNKPPKITVRGIRTQIPPGYLLGRTAPGGGPVQLISAAGARAAIGLTPGYIQVSVSIQKLLDGIGAVQGDILYRDATGWVVLAPGTMNQLLQTGGAAANPAWAGISAILDTIGNTRGMILYRDTSSWSALPPGTAGEVLTTGGPGVNPTWAVASAPSKGTLPLVSGDLPGPALIADGKGQCIAVPL